MLQLKRPVEEALIAVEVFQFEGRVCVCVPCASSPTEYLDIENHKSLGKVIKEIFLFPNMYSFGNRLSCALKIALGCGKALLF